MNGVRNDPMNLVDLDDRPSELYIQFRSVGWFIMRAVT
jgi:hypothetical protein